MKRFPRMNSHGTTQHFATMFGGINLRARASDGTPGRNGAEHTMQFAFAQNLSAKDYPALSTRDYIGTVTEEDSGTLTNWWTYAMLPYGDALWRLRWRASATGPVVNPTAVYAYGQLTNGVDRTRRSSILRHANTSPALPGKLVAMGSNILIFPEKVWVSTVERERGDFSDYADGDRWSAAWQRGQGWYESWLELLDENKQPITTYTTTQEDIAPGVTTDGSYWLYVPPMPTVYFRWRGDTWEAFTPSGTVVPTYNTVDDIPPEGVTPAVGDIWACIPLANTLRRYNGTTWERYDGDVSDIPSPTRTKTYNPPANPYPGSFWLYDPSPVLRKYSASDAAWETVNSYVRFASSRRAYTGETAVDPVPSGIQAGSLVAGDKIRLTVDSAADKVPGHTYLYNNIYEVDEIEDIGWGEKRIIVKGTCVPGTYRTVSTSTCDWLGLYIVKRRRYLLMGNMEQTNSATGVSVSLCKQNGEGFGNVTTSATAPSNPANKALWLDISGEKALLKEWSAEESAWLDVVDTYIKIVGARLDVGLSAGDGVTITGLSDDSLNGAHVISSVSLATIVIPGIISAPLTGQSVTISRTIPDMDFVVECGNRLWGCKYGAVDGKVVNEIYASKLGDFKNWNCFEGLSTDSYVASRGGAGPWTGAIVYNGQPLFFKENCVEKVFPSSSGAHQIITTELLGVQEGSGESLAVLNGILFYKSACGVMAYTGATPRVVSEELGSDIFDSAVAGGLNGVYYICMRNKVDTTFARAGSTLIYTYDIRSGAWHCISHGGVKQFASHGNAIYWIEPSGLVSPSIMSTVLFRTPPEAGSEAEQYFSWWASTVDIGYNDANQKYLSRLQMRLRMNGRLAVVLTYDGADRVDGGDYVCDGTVQSIVIPIPPRRCDHVSIQLFGNAPITIYGIGRYYERGGDQAW